MCDLPFGKHSKIVGSFVIGREGGDGHGAYFIEQGTTATIKVLLLFKY